ncbi:MAG TPA: ABC transporter ATP-binding protein [Chloroflexota bacterium]|nr:ABC transporter ATP-binding protein [Chloroflexota bacterium]
MFWHFDWHTDGARQSGLTGSPDIPDPAPDRPKGLRARLRTVQQAIGGTMAALPRVLRLVWEASPALTIGLGLATILAGITPAATAYTGKLLINAVVQAIQVHANPSLPDQTVLSVPLPGLTLGWAYTTMGAIVALAVAQFAIYALNALLGTTRNISQQLLQEKITLRIQLMVMEHASKLDLPFFESSQSYDLLRRAQNEASTRPVAMVTSAFGLIQTAITFVAMVALLLGVSPLLALIALVSPIPAFVADTRYGWRGFTLARWASPLRRRMDYLVSLVTTDTFAKEVQLFGLGGFFIQRFHLLANTYYDRQRRLVTTRYTVGFLWSTLTTLAGSATYLYVAIQAVVGRLTLGDLTLYTQAASSVQGSIQGLLGGFSGMYEHNLYLTNLFELLETPIRIRRPERPVPLPKPLRGEIEFQHVSFSYSGSGTQALTDVSFRIAPGETIAVVGRNGAGKTTLIKLLCRLYDPSEGRILLDGIDIRDFDPDDLRGAIAAMFQDYVTYQATASENIGLGDLPHLEDRPVIEAASRKAGADELVAGLRDGYDTPLGRWFDGGANLSGGEWQKVALGRAFMREARILVLDEPTSALDAQAEYELFARLRQLSQGRTAIYISHRFSTVRQADRILFLEHGRVVEEGTHEELMALNGRYARLFNLQASAYTGESIELVSP